MQYVCRGFIAVMQGLIEDEEMGKLLMLVFSENKGVRDVVSQHFMELVDERVKEQERLEGEEEEWVGFRVVALMLSEALDCVEEYSNKEIGSQQQEQQQEQQQKEQQKEQDEVVQELERGCTELFFCDYTSQRLSNNGDKIKGFVGSASKHEMWEVFSMLCRTGVA